jgi:hypothetical protein
VLAELRSRFPLRFLGASLRTSPGTPDLSASLSPLGSPPVTRSTTSLPQRRAPNDVGATATSLPPQVGSRHGWQASSRGPASGLLLLLLLVYGDIDQLQPRSFPAAGPPEAQRDGCRTGPMARCRTGSVAMSRRGVHECGAGSMHRRGEKPSKSADAGQLHSQVRGTGVGQSVHADAGFAASAWAGHGSCSRSPVVLGPSAEAGIVGMGVLAGIAESAWPLAARGGVRALVASRRGTRAVSSAGERFPDTEEVTGSNPVRPTR